MSTLNNQNPKAEPQGDAVIAAKPKRPGRWVTPALALVAAIGVGIFGGVLIGQHTGTSSSSQATGFRGGLGGATGAAGAGGAAGGGAAGGGVTSGTVVSVKGDTVVLKTASGSDVTVTTSSTTSVTKSATSSVSALKAGETVTAIGQTDSSGNVTATTVAEGSAPSRGFGGGSAKG